jgi:hypothetical protein
MDSNWTLNAIDKDDLKQLIKKINTLKAINTKEFSSSAPTFQIVWTILHSILPLLLSVVAAVEDQHSCCDKGSNNMDLSILAPVNHLHCCCLFLPRYLFCLLPSLDQISYYVGRILLAFRPRGVPGPTSKFVAARPSPDGLPRDGTQGGKRGSCYPAPGGCACSRGYKRSQERERE